MIAIPSCLWSVLVVGQATGMIFAIWMIVGIHRLVKEKRNGPNSQTYQS